MMSLSIPKFLAPNRAQEWRHLAQERAEFRAIFKRRRARIQDVLRAKIEGVG